MANVVMHGIHDVFPANENNKKDPILLKKMLKKEGAWAVVKEILGFDFDGNPDAHTMTLPDEKRDELLDTLLVWIRGSRSRANGIPSEEFHETMSKVRHASTSIPAGYGLLSLFNALLGKKPPVVYLHKNTPLLTAIQDACHLLHLATKFPTPYKELVTVWPHYIGVKDASSHGVGGVIVSEEKPTSQQYFASSGRMT